MTATKNDDYEDSGNDSNKSDDYEDSGNNNNNNSNSNNNNNRVRFCHRKTPCEGARDT